MYSNVRNRAEQATVFWLLHAGTLYFCKPNKCPSYMKLAMSSQLLDNKFFVLNLLCHSFYFAFVLTHILFIFLTQLLKAN